MPSLFALYYTETCVSVDQRSNFITTLTHLSLSAVISESLYIVTFAIIVKALGKIPFCICACICFIESYFYEDISQQFLPLRAFAACFDLLLGWDMGLTCINKV